MRKFIVWLTVAGMLFSALPGYTGERDRDEAKKKAEDAKNKSDREKEKDKEEAKDELRDKADDNTKIDIDDDEGINAGAIIGGVAVAALVGTVAVKAKGAKEKKAEAAKAGEQPAAETPGEQSSITFESMDADKDQKLSKEEYLTTMKEAYKTADKDGNGTITREEAVEAYGDRGAKYFDSLDTKKAGSLEISAMEADATKAFEWADANDDGFYTAEEKAAAQKANTEAEEQQKQGKGSNALRKIRKSTS